MFYKIMITPEMISHLSDDELVRQSLMAENANFLQLADMIIRVYLKRRGFIL